MERSEWGTCLATGALTVSLLLIGCARDSEGPTAAAPAPAPVATGDATVADAKLATVTLNVKGMT
jgi:hypothetical protein